MGLAKLICGGATPITCNKASTVLHNLIGDFSSKMSGAEQTSTYACVEKVCRFFSKLNTIERQR